MQRFPSFLVLVLTLVLFCGCGSTDDPGESCENHSDCTKDFASYCSPEEECVECVENEHCEEGYICTDDFVCEEVHVTEGCTSHDDCAESGARYCDLASGDCVECVENEHCEEGYICADDFACEEVDVTEECTSHDDCAESGAQYCDLASGDCVECVENEHWEEGYICADEFVCEEEDVTEECTSHNDCTESDAQYCDLHSGDCVECVENEHCEEGYICTGEFVCEEEEVAEHGSFEITVTGAVSEVLSSGQSPVYFSTDPCRITLTDMRSLDPMELFQVDIWYHECDVCPEAGTYRAGGDPDIGCSDWLRVEFQMVPGDSGPEAELFTALDGTVEITRSDEALIAGDLSIEFFSAHEPERTIQLVGSFEAIPAPF